MTSAKDYWTNKDLGPHFAAPNIALFRFFGHAGFDFAGKSVLEIGFGHGADLLEAARRGASIHGIDINAVAVESMRRRTGLDTFVTADAAHQPITFPVAFDAIYACDTIYYLGDDEIHSFARHCFAALAPGGRVVIHFIEGDWQAQAHPSGDLVPVLPAGAWTRLEQSFAAGNPLRMLDAAATTAIFEAAGGRLTGRKSLCETHGVTEETLRSQRYLLFERR